MVDACPCHPSPEPDELLSSWLVRLAIANQSKLQTLCSQFLPDGHSMWARDIDRSVSPMTVQAIAKLTAQKEEVVWGTTLKAYEGELFPESNSRNAAYHFLPLGVYHRTRRCFGQMYCPQCLAGDDTPYFRRIWRLTLATVCSIHRCLLLDQCPNCGATLSFFRQTLGQHLNGALQSICRCSNCSADLRESHATISRIAKYQIEAHIHMLEMIAGASSSELPSGANIVDYLEVVQHVAQYSLSRRRSLASSRFRALLADIVTPGALIISDARSLDRCSVYERHIGVSRALWLLEGWPMRLYEYGERGDLCSSELLRDFPSAPGWYRNPIRARFFKPIPSFRMIE